MTLFEYLTVAVSIVLALGLVRLVDGLGAVFDPARRYWIHLFIVFALISTHLYYWWSLWMFREGVRWNFGFFILVVLGALILSFGASAAVPRDLDAVRSWKEHYFLMHRRVYLALAAWVAHMLLMSFLLRDARLPPTLLAASLFAIGMNILGAVSSSERVHRVLAVVAIVFGVSVMVVWSAPAQL